MAPRSLTVAVFLLLLTPLILNTNLYTDHLPSPQLSRLQTSLHGIITKNWRLSSFTPLSSSRKMASSQAHCSSKSPAVIGSTKQPNSFWLWTTADGYDLTRPSSPASAPLYPCVKLATTTSPVTIHPPKTALIIIDMQNFFLSTAVGRRPDNEGHMAEKTLLEHGIPAARKAGIQIVWLTWGVEEEDLDGMLPTMLRIFRFQITHADEGGVDDAPPRTIDSVDGGAEDRITAGGVGYPIGNVTLEDGSTVDGGRLLMKGAWNTRLHPPLEAAFNEGLTSSMPDVRFDKERLSGMWGSSTPLTEYLKNKGFTTLLFTGVNTDQCVLATMQDAVFKGWDCLLLKDGCGTNSPEFARRATEFNGEQSWGFVSTCQELSKAVDGMTTAPRAGL